eukprot:scaffold75458_cov31-Tisochrysis_lutea.AAC.3
MCRRARAGDAAMRGGGRAQRQRDCNRIAWPYHCVQAWLARAERTNKDRVELVRRHPCCSTLLRCDCILLGSERGIAGGAGDRGIPIKGHKAFKAGLLLFGGLKLTLWDTSEVAAPSRDSLPTESVRGHPGKYQSAGTAPRCVNAGRIDSELHESAEKVDRPRRLICACFVHCG